MSTNEGCACNAAPRLIFACSGGADVGALADQAARKLTREGAGKMFCLAGIGGRISGIMKSTEAGASILAIDGCPIGCAMNTLKQAGFADFEHLQLADLGLAKGQSPATDENIATVCAAAVERLTAK